MAACGPRLAAGWVASRTLRLPRIDEAKEVLMDMLPRAVILASLTFFMGCDDGASGGSAATGAGSSQGGSAPVGGAGGEGGDPSGSGSGAFSSGSGASGSVASGPATSGPGSTGVGGEGGGSTTGGGAAGPGVGGGGPMGLPTLGTLVVLGDSISDGGGQSPFYYNLLRNDLEAHYGTTLAYHRNAESGSKTNALMGQIDDLPNTLPGPVAVAITSGGNDMKAALPLIVAGADANARATMLSNIDNAIATLTEADHFGPGVQVYVFHANIYDASDGVGDFGSNGCNFGQGLPTIPTDTFFANWNGAIATAVNTHGQTVADMHGLFTGHGYDGAPNWFASDCTHPNQLGHAALATYFGSLITGN